MPDALTPEQAAQLAHRRNILCLDDPPHDCLCLDCPDCVRRVPETDMTAGVDDVWRCTRCDAKRFPPTPAPARRLGRFVVALALLVAVSGAEAGAKRPPAPPSSAWLTVPELLCEIDGHMVFSRAVERDLGATLVDSLARTRQEDARHDTAAARRAWHEDLTIRVFAQAALSPHQLQRQAELACVIHTRTAPPPVPTLRY